VAAPSAQQQEVAEHLRAVSQEGRELAGELGKSTAELAARSDPDQVKADNLTRKSLDVTTLARQEGIEVGAGKPHIAWLEKLDRGVVAALRGVELAAGVGKITVRKIGEVLIRHVTDWLDAAREGAEETRALIAELKKKWTQERNASPPDRGPGPSPRDFSIFHDPFSIFHDSFKNGAGRGPDLVVIPAGEFLMGSAESEAGLKDDDRAFDNEIVKGEGKRSTHILRRFALGRYPVTFDDYDAFLAARAGRRVRKPNDEASNPSEWGRRRRPVINVSWNDAHRYCKWLNERTGLRGDRRYRLPSEAEWEYACRVGTDTRRWWGDEWDPAKANGNKSFEEGKTSPVDHYAANPWELHDMIGNVWEWCADEYAENISMLPADGSPYGKLGKSNRSLRVLRGGSWSIYPQGLRSAIRGKYQPVIRVNDVGFRVARTL
jgi:formylglycine-generating enzyme required for sulfatase activity